MTNSRNTSELSIVDGGPPPAMTVPNLGEALLRAGRLPADKHLTYIADDGSESFQTYSDLVQESLRILAGIRSRERGPVQGDHVLLQINHAPSLLAAFWGCILGGFVPAPVSANPPPSAGISAAELLTGVWGALDRRAWVLTDGSQEALRPLGANESPAWEGRLLADIATLRQHAPAPFSSVHGADPEEVAVLLLTSGSTGLPKEVRLTHRNILSRAIAASQLRDLTAENRSFNWLPLDHVGGLVMFHIRDVLLGCNQVHAHQRWVMADPLRWLDAMSKYRSSSTWAPNFAFGLINDRAQDFAGRSWDLSGLRYIMNGGEPVKARVARSFLSLLAPFGLPPTAIHPGWGMSETSAGVVESVFDPDVSGDDDRFVSLGRPHPGVRLRVVDEQGSVLPAGTVGRLQAAGASITSGYENNPAQNRLSFTEDGWFKSGDLAFIRNGALTVTGRAGDIIEAGGVSYHSHEIEAAVEELPFVEPSYTVACTDERTNPSNLLVFLNLRPDTNRETAVVAVRQHVATRFGAANTSIVCVDREEVPKTGIGKLRREHLRQRYAL